MYIYINVSDSQIYISSPDLYSGFRTLSSTPTGQYIQFDISTWIANEHLKLNVFNTDLLILPYPK